METFPKKGMKFEQSRSRLLKYGANTFNSNPNLAASLINQVKIHEGEGAAKELAHEFVRTRVDTNNHSSGKLGYSPSYSDKYDSIFGSGKSN